ncbi:fumarylacetoacetate hydrolase family protein [Alkalibacillus aidingensis]|uniref:fumarylacetoacetate hydrolase family protein n=1 Tax=Alkalibacillus aidingensis TaxID=2747607 RepID=UPI00166139BB|nr:fumarylacetoacetate hydrolase family protein [Alkalibacillus aidingensis]
MRFVTFKHNRQTYWGIEEEEGIYYSAKLVSVFPTLLSMIENSSGIDFFKEINQFIQHSEAKILAPFIPRKNIMCIGKNYRDHALEMTGNDEGQVPKSPVIFTKSPSAVIGPNEAIDAHEMETGQLDYEGELAVIIGKRGKNISREDALDYVFGYTIFNDVTARDLQKKHQQFFRGKSLDTFGPFGPSVLTKDEVKDPQSLSIQTFVNGELRQSSNTAHMIFPIDQLIETLSDGMTLEPGDVIATGTPSGVGKGFNPPKFLKSGDRVRIEIDEIGVLENDVV